MAARWGVDKLGPVCLHLPSPSSMTTSAPQQQTPTPAELPFTQPQAMVRFVTDTGKILPRKYTGLSAKQQRKVTSIIKTSRNLLTMQ